MIQSVAFLTILFDSSNQLFQRLAAKNNGRIINHRRGNTHDFLALPQIWEVLQVNHRRRNARIQ